jgi:two-component system response regulator HydG
MKKKILLVDDEANIRNLLVLALTRKGYEVSAADSGLEAKRLARESTPDLLISDLQMEDTDGFTLIAELKESLPQMPVLLLTGVIFDPETIAEALNKKISGYISKTESLKTILGEIHRLCPAN